MLNYTANNLLGLQNLTIFWLGCIDCQNCSRVDHFSLMQIQLAVICIDTGRTLLPERTAKYLNYVSSWHEVFENQSRNREWSALVANIWCACWFVLFFLDVNFDNHLVKTGMVVEFVKDSREWRHITPGQQQFRFRSIPAGREKFPLFGKRK